MPSGAARELLALDQDYIGNSALCQVIGNAAANNAAANNHYFGATWQIRHNGPLGGFGGDISVTYYDIQIIKGYKHNTGALRPSRPKCPS